VIKCYALKKEPKGHGSCYYTIGCKKSHTYLS